MVCVILVLHLAQLLSMGDESVVWEDNYKRRWHVSDTPRTNLDKMGIE